MWNSFLFILVVNILAAGSQSWATNACSRLFSERLPVERLERWPQDGPQVFPPYDFSVRDILKAKGVSDSDGYFEKFLNSRKSEGVSANVLDLMGSGYFIKDPNIAGSITGLRYNSLSLNEKEIEIFGRRQEVTGDIFAKSTWEKLRQSMTERKIVDQDLIVMRPEGGWSSYAFHSTEHQAKSLVFILWNAVSILNPKGEIYFALELPSFKGDFSEHPDIMAFKERLENETNYEMSLFSTYWPAQDMSPRVQGVIRSK